MDHVNQVPRAMSVPTLFSSPSGLGAVCSPCVREGGQRDLWPFQSGMLDQYYKPWISR